MWVDVELLLYRFKSLLAHFLLTRGRSGRLSLGNTLNMQAWVERGELSSLLLFKRPFRLLLSLCHLGSHSLVEMFLLCRVLAICCVAHIRRVRVGLA